MFLRCDSTDYRNQLPSNLVPVMFAYLQDLPGAMSCDNLVARLNLHKLCCGRAWKALPCDASSGNGLEEGLLWLSRQLVAAGVLEVA